MASEAEVIARRGNENQIKDIDGLSKKQKALKKDKDSGFNGLVYLPGFEDEEEQQDEEKQDKPASQDTDSTNDEDINENTFSNYHFRLNSDHMIEVFNSETLEIIRTISPDDAAKVLLNLSDVPGFIVNESV